MAKRKPKVIHVDKLIINAKEVIINNEGTEEQVVLDPWGFSIGNEEEQQPESGAEENASATNSEEEGQSDQTGWSWI